MVGLAPDDPAPHPVTLGQLSEDVLSIFPERILTLGGVYAVVASVTTAEWIEQEVHDESRTQDGAPSPERPGAQAQ